MKRARLMARVTACWLAAVQPVLRRPTMRPCRLVIRVNRSRSLKSTYIGFGRAPSTNSGSFFFARTLFFRFFRLTNAMSVAFYALKKGAENIGIARCNPSIVTNFRRPTRPVYYRRDGRLGEEFFQRFFAGGLGNQRNDDHRRRRTGDHCGDRHHACDGKI